MLAFISRLIAFLIVLSIVKSVLRFALRFWHGLTRPAPSAAAPRRPASPTTHLYQDPVCGAYVALEGSLKKIVAGQVLHFCSAECRDRYRG